MKKLNIISIIIIAAYICYIIATRDKSDIDYSYSAQAVAQGGAMLYMREQTSNSFKVNINPNQYRIEKKEGGYDVTLYNKFNKKVYAIRYDKEPWVKDITDDILEIGINTASSASYVFYYNKATSQVSRRYFNPKLINNEYVAYMENDETLIFADIFDESLLREEIVRDFTKMSDPMAAIIDIYTDGEIVLKYYQGEDCREGTEKLIIGSPIDSNDLWNEKLVIDDKGYHISFRRISRLRNVDDDFIGDKTDYCLSINDVNNNILQEIRVDEFPMRFEEVYWLKDINNDNALDIILCTWFSNGRYRYTGLNFYVWNKAEEIFELKTLPDEDMQSPVWNGELGTIMYWVDGQNDWVWNMKMYIMKENEWELYAEFLHENDEEPPVFADGYERERYYEELDYADRQIFYENGKVIKEITEPASWLDESSIWYRDNENNQQLHPGTLDWETIDVVEPRHYWKYVRKQGDTE